MKTEEKLYVFYKDMRVGQIKRDEELLYSFQYDEAWLKYQNCFALSLGMPLQEESFGNRTTLSFFENLLPEGDTREFLKIDQNLQSEFDLLKKFGSDCAGAFIISGSKKSHYQNLGPSKEIPIDMTKIYEAIDSKRPVIAVIADLGPGYLSIAGAQDKFAAIYRGGKFFLPTSGRPTTHIVKVPILRSNVKESVYNEYYCMNLARKVGLVTPDCFVIGHKTHPLYVTVRYDRFVDKEDSVQRYHQEDFCQAQGFVSENKYEERGGPSIKANYELIKAQVTIKKRKQATLDFLDWICFNFLLGNNDSHSKNLSFLLKDGRIELAPFYDIVCTAIYPNIRDYFSFKIGGRNEQSRIRKNQLNVLDKELGLKRGTMIEIMVAMKQKLLAQKDEIVSEVREEFPDSKIPARISELIGQRCRSLERQGIN